VSVLEAKNDRTVKTMKSVYARNEARARSLNAQLTSSAVYTVNIMGAPGAGKTTVLTGLSKVLHAPTLVIEGDIESELDTQKLRGLGISSFQINTGGACHLDVAHIRAACEGRSWKNCFLFIENIGNLDCPAEFSIGEHVKILIASVAEGSDKPYKYPLAFEKADAIILNKIDLLPYAPFDEVFFEEGVRGLNPTAPIFKTSALKEEGLGELAQWLKQKRTALFPES
jgi:hydrogenase nickel incorporation protein HypB